MTSKKLKSIDHALSVSEDLGFSREAGQSAISVLLEHIGYVVLDDEDDDRAALNYDLFVAQLAQHSPSPP